MPGLEREAVRCGPSSPSPLSSSEQVAGALADSVDGAFDLPRPGLHSGDGV